MGWPASERNLNNFAAAFIRSHRKFYVSTALLDASAKPFQSHEIRAAKLNLA